ncbi:MAG: hypothetical protein O7B99_13120 [Planctomycetota bacterium]|nr:hypothetical protein [Planctomycetota bacterium]
MRESFASEQSLLIGTGRRLEELGAVLGALASVHFKGDAPVAEGLADLADLMEGRTGPGTLLLDSEEVPTEDIGFVRRFLERQPDWQLVLVGEDSRDGKAQRLLSFRGARWITWPPDLEQVKALLLAHPREGETATRPAPAARDPELVPRAAAPARTKPKAEPRSTGGSVSAAPASADTLDVGALLEEVLAGRAVASDEAPRYLYRSEVELPVQVERSRLVEAVEGLLTLAEACCDAGEVIGVRSERDEATDQAVVAIDFPPGPLTDGDLPVIFCGEFRGEAELEEAVSRARGARRELVDLGGDAALAMGKPGRLSLNLTLPLAGTGV